MVLKRVLVSLVLLFCLVIVGRVIVVNLFILSFLSSSGCMVFLFCWLVM